jgi:hypothetical protein
MDVSSDFTLPPFGSHVTILNNTACNQNNRQSLKFGIWNQLSGSEGQLDLLGLEKTLATCGSLREQIHETGSY